MITADAQQLEPGGRVTVYELDASSFGADQLFFHAHLQSGVIWWQGQEYGAWPIEATGFERTSDQPPNPRLKVGNLDGRIAAMCMLYGDMVGAKVIRRQTLVKYLDAANFPPLRNMARNSSFEVSANATSIPTGWNLERIRSDVGGAISYVPSPLPGGGRAVRLEWNALNSKDWAGINLAGPGANYIRVETNTDYVNSSYVRGTPGSKAQIYVQWLNSTGGTVLGTVTLPEVTMDGSWKRLILPALSRGDAVLARLYVGRQFAQAAGAHFIEIDNAQFEQGTVATEYQFTGTDLEAGRNPTADPNEHFLDEIWFIERKVSETKEVVEFELTTAIDLNGEQLPGRQVIAGVCGWLIRGGYRGPFCGYTGPAVADANDVPTTDPSRDQCGGRVRSCKLRFGADKPLPYGGFPAAGLLRT